MAALAADRQTRFRAGGSVRSGLGDVAAATKIFNGSLIARNATGFIVPASDAAAVKVVGLAQQFVDNTAGADGALTVQYITGLEVELVNNAGAVVQAGKHAVCYAADDNSVTSAAASLHKVLAGTVTQFTAALVWVFVEDIQAADVAPAVVVNGAVSPAVLSSSPIEVIAILIPADVVTTTYTYLNADKIEIVEFEAIKDTAGAANTIQLFTTALVAISDALAYAVDKAKSLSATLDVAQRTILANAGFKITVTRAAGTNAGSVFLHVIRR